MADLLDRDNLHIFLEKMNNKDNSFIANVNLLASNLDNIKVLQGLFDPGEVDVLVEFLTKYNVGALLDDLNKGSLNGYRKLDINLIRNMSDFTPTMTQEEMTTLWNDMTKRLYYESVTVHFTDQTSLTKDFTQLGVPTLINNHNDLYDQFNEWPEFLSKVHGIMFDVFSDTITVGDWGLLRFYDADTQDGNIDKITLTVTTQTINQNFDPTLAQAKTYEPVYSWVDTSSVLETIAQRINDLIRVGRSSDELLQINNYLSQLMSIYAVLDQLASTDASKETIYKNLSKLLSVADALDKITDVADLNQRLVNVETNKANKFDVEESIGYSVVATISDSDTSLNYVVGEEAIWDIFTFTVTAVSTEGKVLAGTITPNVVVSDFTGTHLFTSNGTGTELSLDIECTSQGNAEVTKDLVDVYTELKTKAIAATEDLHTLFAEVEELNTNLAALEEALQNVSVGDGTTFANFVLKTSNIPQVINSSLTLGAGKNLSGTKTDGTAHVLVESRTLTSSTDSGEVVRDTVQVGTTSEHLNLNTNNDPIYQNKVTVLTPTGRKVLVYTEDLVDEVAINFLLGSCIAWAGATIPDQTKLAVGTTYNIEDYPEAAAILGTQYGGDGVTTFGTPNLSAEPPTSLRWIIVLGKDNGSSSRLYCGRAGIYCGLPGLYPGMEVTS